MSGMFQFRRSKSKKGNGKEELDADTKEAKRKALQNNLEKAGFILNDDLKRNKPTVVPDDESRHRIPRPR